MSNQEIKHIITQISQYVYLGSFEPAFTQSDEFKKLAIDVVINCAYEIKYPDVQYPFILESFPIKDNDTITMLEQMDNAISRIHYYLARRKKIYLHCVNGDSVAPSILIYYLMMHKSYTWDQSCKFIKKLRPSLDISFEFENQFRVIEQV